MCFTVDWKWYWHHFAGILFHLFIYDSILSHQKKFEKKRKTTQFGVNMKYVIFMCKYNGWNTPGFSFFGFCSHFFHKKFSHRRRNYYRICLFFRLDRMKFVCYIRFWTIIDRLLVMLLVLASVSDEISSFKFKNSSSVDDYFIDIESPLWFLKRNINSNFP